MQHRCAESVPFHKGGSVVSRLVVAFTGIALAWGAFFSSALADGDAVDLLKQTPLRLDLQRPVDRRLKLIEERGIEGSGLFRGKIHMVRNADEVNALSGRLKPGDQLVLAGSDWKNARFTFAGIGTPEAPILIRPQVPGQVVLSGKTEVAFEGEHLVITGLVFRHVTVERPGTVVMRLGVTQDRLANQCIIHDIRMEDCNSPDLDSQRKLRMWYLTIRGRDNTVANSLFAGMKNYGQMLAAQELPAKGLLRLHVLNNRFVRRPYVDNQNGYEVIQIGWSGEKAKSAASLIQGNHFENCDGENELITLKASDIVVRQNSFIGCQGVVSVRAGNRVLVQGNVFDGRDRPNTGGVRLQGSGHVIVDNVFRHLRKPKNYYSWTISLMAASCENYGDGGDVAGYGRAKDILIAHNLFESCDSSIAVGIYPRPQYPLLPRRIRVVDNVFRSDKPMSSPFDYVAPDPTGELKATLVESNNRFEVIQ